MKRLAACALILVALPAMPARADPPVIEAVRARQTAGGWQIDVTLSHPDTGWSHYADGWRVLDMEGNELGRRVLSHPHVTEQPFTRSLTGLQLPEGTTRVQLQARCLVDGWNSKTTTVTLP